MNPIDEIYLGLNQVAERYSTSKRTIYRRIQEGTFPHPMQFGGRKKWSLSALSQFEESKSQKGDSK